MPHAHDRFVPAAPRGVSPHRARPGARTLAHRAPSLAALVALALSGCDLPCDDDCSDRRPRPIQGAPADFMAPTGDAAYVVSPPEACGDDLAFLPTWTHWVDIEGTGTRPLTTATADAGPDAADRGAFVSVLFASLRNAGHPVNEAGVGLSCGHPGGVPFVTTDDWHATGAIARAIGDAMAADDIGALVELRVGQEVILCPQVACGW